MADDQRPTQDALEREARRLEKIRNLRLVERPAEQVVVSADVEYEPEDAA